MSNTETSTSIVIEPKQAANASIIWLHGLGADAHDFEGIVPQLQLPETIQARFIFPNAPVRPVTINMGQPCRAWYDIRSLVNIQNEDSKGIQASQSIVDNYIQHEIASGIPANKIIIAGFSQGGAIALYAGLRYPEKLAGILALSTYLPLIDTLQPNEFPQNHHTPILQIHGMHDDILPYELAEHTEATLKQLDYHITWKTYPIGHHVSMDEINDIRHWLIDTLN